MAVHGDITEVRYNHPTLGSGIFFPKANEGNVFDPGGLRNNDDTSMVAGNGSVMFQKNRIAGSFTVLIENDSVSRKDYAKVQALQASSASADYTITHVNGSVWKVTGQPVGAIEVDVNAGTFTLKVVGKTEQIA